jgi:hypothetical protein
MKGYKVFISYSHTDENLCKQLINHLSALKRRGLIREWHDRRIMPGEDWDKSIKQELLDSDIVLLLISSDFIASEYCFDIEISKAMEKHEQKTAIVIPIVLRPCDWTDLPFGKIQGLPKDAKPITTWSNIDEAFVNTIEGIKTIINHICTNSNETSLPVHFEKEEETEYLSFERDVVLCMLPRGYIVIEDIEFKTYSQWSVVASYFTYEGNWQHGTHYHESYRRSWETLEGHYTQCKKLFIPKADFNYADSAIELMMRLRERKESESIDSIIELYSSDKSLDTYYRKGSKIPRPAVPSKYSEQFKTGDLRDIIEELSISSWQNYKLETLHENFESLRRKALIIIYDILSNNHPAFKFVEDIVNDYNSNYTLDELIKWSNKLSDALYDTFKYIK